MTHILPFSALAFHEVKMGDYFIAATTNYFVFDYKLLIYYCACSSSNWKNELG